MFRLDAVVCRTLSCTDVFLWGPSWCCIDVVCFVGLQVRECVWLRLLFGQVPCDWELLRPIHGGFKTDVPCIWEKCSFLSIVGLNLAISFRRQEPVICRTLHERTDGWCRERVVHWYSYFVSCRQSPMTQAADALPSTDANTSLLHFRE
jgi:hypothetical protein